MRTACPSITRGLARPASSREKMNNYNLFLDLGLTLELHPLEKKLIETLRSIDSAVVSKIKVQDGLPVLFYVELDEESFHTVKST